MKAEGEVEMKAEMDGIVVAIGWILASALMASWLIYLMFAASGGEVWWVTAKTDTQYGVCVNVILPKGW